MEQLTKKQLASMRADRVIAFIETYLFIPEGTHVGKPFILDVFQKRFVRAVYSGSSRRVRRAILSMARKNGKTALIAALVLVHLVGPEAMHNTQIVSGAMSRDQAAIVFDLALKMVNLSPILAPLVRSVPSRQRLYGLPMNVEYRALSAEGKTAHGLSPVLAILDELGQVRGPRDAFVEAVVTAQGAHANPLQLIISTQAESDTDMLSVMIDDALENDDGTTICHLYTAPEGCDVMDRAAWQAANPALGIFRDEADMADLAGKASRMPSMENAFRNLNLNQRISVTSPFVSKTSWASCSEAPLPLSECDEVFAGMDLSMKTDLTALVFVGKKGEDLHVHPYFWTPEIGLLDRAKADRAPYDLWANQNYLITVPGATVEYDFIARWFADEAAGMEFLMWFDRYRMKLLQKELDDIGHEVNMKECGQGFIGMNPCIEALESAILNKRLFHGSHPVLNMCVANAITQRNPVGERKFDKKRARGRIDGAVALAMACGAAAGGEGGGSFDQFLSNPVVINRR